MAGRRDARWEVDSQQQEVKSCKHCNESKPLSDFRKRAASKDGRAWLCKPCHRAYEAEHRERNRDRYRERQTQWYEDNPGGRRRHRVTYNKEHPWENRIRVANRRAKELDAPGTLTEADWEYVLEKYGDACLRCGTFDDVQIDHVVPLTRGGLNVGDNLQPLCQACNKTKRQKVEDYRQGRMAG